MTADLLADLYAEIDRREREATTDRNMGHYRRAAVDYPALTLAGHAEDRDILRRHEPDRVPLNDPGAWSCDACTYEADDHWYSRYVDWPCVEVLSVARRLNVEVSS